MKLSAESLGDSTPILVGAGQLVERQANDISPMGLASQAASNAIRDCAAGGGDAAMASAIDTICVTKLFSDMGSLWACKWGRSDNPPESIARFIGASPKHRIYTQTGGNEPQSRLIEFARAIARGERSAVLIAGAEAIRNQRHAERDQRELDWSEHFEEGLEDRGFGEHVITSQEINNGLTNVVYYYSLIEQAQRHAAGRSIEEHQQAMAQLLESFSAVAARNPYAQFSGSQSAEQILAAPSMTHLYSKRMIAQDGVNQGAAVLMCSIGKAKQLGIDESRWIYLHGLAEGCELEVTRRPDPGVSPMAGMVVDKALAMAGLTIADINFIDIYSCFPCAVTAIATHLGLPVDGSRQLTLTGGLPYFGGPGNNYSMHALAEAVWRARKDAETYAMVTANGGMLSKHAVGIFSRRPCNIDWASTDTYINRDALASCKVCADPQSGSIISYTVHHESDGSAHAIIIGQTDSGQRFVSRTAEDDTETASAMLAQDPTGNSVIVTAAGDERLHFRLRPATT